MDYIALVLSLAWVLKSITIKDTVKRVAYIKQNLKTTKCVLQLEVDETIRDYFRAPPLMDYIALVVTCLSIEEHIC